MPVPVLLDATPLARGHGQRGIGTALRHLVEHLAHQRRPTLLTLPGQEIPPEFGRRDFRWPKWPTHRIPDPWPSMKLHDALLADPPGLFHATQPELTPDPHIVPTVITCYDLIPLHRPIRNPLHRFAYGTYLQRLTRAEHIITISHAVRDDLAAQLGIPESRVHVIHLGPPPVHTPAGVTPKTPYVLYSNSIEPHKNPRLIIDAFAAVRGVDLVMTGPWSRRRRDRLERHAERVGAASRIHWLGYVEPSYLAALRRDALATATPSTMEGFGFPVLESLLAGTPALAADIPALREAGGDAAVYLPLDDPTAWADAIHELRGQDERREEMAERGHRHAATFDWDRTARETVMVWDEARRG